MSKVHDHVITGHLIVPGNLSIRKMYACTLDVIVIFAIFMVTHRKMPISLTIIAVYIHASFNANK